MAVMIPKDWAGWLLSAFIPLMIYYHYRKSDKYKIVFTILVISTVHTLVSIYNNYFFQIPGSTADALRFSQTAADMARHHIFEPGLYERFYEFILSILYRISPDQFFGQEFSVFLFTLSLILLSRLIDFLEINYAPIIICFIGFMPNNLLWTSITLREALEFLSLVSTIYIGILMKANHYKRKYFLLFIGAILLLTITHEVYFLIAPVLFPLIYLWPYNENFHVFIKEKIYIIINIVLASIIAVLLAVKYLSSTFNFSLNIDDFYRILHFVKRFRSAIWPAHTSYSVPMIFHSFHSTVVTLFKFFCYYLFSPFPWDKLNIYDIPVMLYHWFIIFMIFMSLFFIIQSKGTKRKTMSMLLTLFFVMTFFWSLGVVNYGTGLRHEILTDWIVIVLGVPYLIEKLGIIFKVPVNKTLNTS